MQVRIQCRIFDARVVAQCLERSISAQATLPIVSKYPPSQQAMMAVTFLKKEEAHNVVESTNLYERMEK